MPVRLLTPIEKNHLIRFGFDPEKISDFGEKPVEYITGFSQFIDQDLVVDQHVLIPRVETEELVEKIVDVYSNDKKVKFLEVGTGSGAIGLTIFRKLRAKRLEVEAELTDISAQALVIAGKNLVRLIERHDQAKIKLIQADLLEKIENLSQFDFCIANLPYIPSQRIKQLASSVKDFEPIVALDGGVDGLTVISKLIVQLKAKQFKGKLFLEIDDTHDDKKLANLFSGFENVWKDQFDKNRFASFNFRKKA
ncbi:MAG: N5-glutamine methyltransferase family protein [Patescibacteria group bacterium]